MFISCKLHLLTRKPSAFYPVVKIFCLLSFATLFVSAASSDSSDAVQRLQLERYSEEEVKGCYYFNQTLGVCFDVLKDSMKLQKTTGEDIVVFVNLGPNMFYYQVLDQGFIGHVSRMIFVPSDISRVPGELRAFLALTHEQATEEQEKLKSHYQQAVSELHYVPEMLLLERLTEALEDNTTQYDILQPFRTLSLNLLKVSETDTPVELKALASLQDDESFGGNDPRKKRCASLRGNPYNNNCFGMCGAKCWCWSIVCGDCCWHQGCYEHDKCCDHWFWSTYCITPFSFNFRCSGFGGYPRCLR